jgi:ribosome-associated protein
MTAKRPASRSTTSKTATKKKTSAAALSRAQPHAKAKTKVPAAGKVRVKAAAKAAPRKVATPKPVSKLRDVVLGALAELKALDVKALDVRGLTDITDTMVVASGTSDRHVKSLAERVTQRCKEAGFRPFGIEGERDGEWVLLDLQDVVLHVMLPRVREFYALEKLWEGGAAA